MIKQIKTVIIILLVTSSFYIFNQNNVQRVFNKQLQNYDLIKTDFDRVCKIEINVLDEKILDKKVIRKINDIFLEKEINYKIKKIIETEKDIDYYIYFYRKSGSSECCLDIAYKSKDISNKNIINIMSYLQNKVKKYIFVNHTEIKIDNKINESVIESVDNNNLKDKIIIFCKKILLLTLVFIPITFLLKLFMKKQHIIQYFIVFITLSSIFILSDILFIENNIFNKNYYFFKESWEYFRIEKNFNIKYSECENANVKSDDLYEWIKYPNTLDFARKVIKPPKWLEDSSFWWSNYEFECVKKDNHYVFATNYEKESIELDDTYEVENEYGNDKSKGGPVTFTVHKKNFYKYLNEKQKKYMYNDFEKGFKIFKNYCRNNGIILDNISKTRFVNNYPNPPIIKYKDLFLFIIDICLKIIILLRIEYKYLHNKKLEQI